jgi:hypothetical protein
MSWSLVGVPGGSSGPTSDHDIAVRTASAGLTAVVAATEKLRSVSTVRGSILTVSLDESRWDLMG